MRQMLWWPVSDSLRPIHTTLFHHTTLLSSIRDNNTHKPHHTSFELEGKKCGVATPHFFPSNLKEVWRGLSVVSSWGKVWCGVVKRSVM